MLQLLLTEYEPTYTYINYSANRGVSWSDYKFYLPMALFCFAVAAWMIYTKAYRYNMLKKSCTFPVEARMFAVDYKHGGKGGRFWNITYEFFYNERRYIASHDYWEQIGHYYKPQVGDEVSILINPMNPNEFYDAVTNGGRKTGLIMGTFFVALGILMLIMPFFT